MYFYLIGIDFKKASLSVREGLYIKRRQIIQFWDNRAVLDAMVLSTCNRIEVYILASDEKAALWDIANFNNQFPDFFKYGYSLRGEKDIFGHALRVACGLESQLQGELEIRRQLESWYQNRYTSETFFNFWQKIIHLSDDIRIETGLNQQKHNLATLVYADLMSYLPYVSTPEIIIMGTGKIAELLAVNRQNKIRLSFVAHKNRVKAEELARHSGGVFLSFRELPQALLSADVLISATSSPHLVFSENFFRGISAQRKSTLYLYDLAIPRDIDPRVNKLENIFLKNLDELTPIFQIYDLQLRQSLDLAECLVKKKIKEYRGHIDERKIKARYAPEPFSYSAG